MLGNACTRVSHPSNNRAQRRLTSVIVRELVFPSWSKPLCLKHAFVPQNVWNPPTDLCKQGSNWGRREFSPPCVQTYCCVQCGQIRLQGRKSQEEISQFVEMTPEEAVVQAVRLTRVVGDKVLQEVGIHAAAVGSPVCRRPTGPHSLRKWGGRRMTSLVR